MPLPTPTAGESENEFVARFMADPDMVAEYPDEKQRVAIAYKQAGAAKLAGRAEGIEILRSGEFTGMGGVKVKISDADMDTIAANFNAHPDVPMVLGHDENSPVLKGNLPTDTPAAGWASKVYVATTAKGKRLLADIAQIPDLVGSWVNAKVYRKVSAMLMRGENGMYLGHIGLLGAKPPAVQGLSDFPAVSFAKHGDAAVVVTMLAERPERSGDVDRAAAVKKLQELGADPAAYADSVSDEDVIKKAEELAKAADDKKSAEPPPPPPPPPTKLSAEDLSEATRTFNAARDEAKKATAEAKEAIAALSAANRSTRVARVETVFSAAIKDGRMSPAEAAAMKPAALALVNQDGVVVELASGTGTKKVSALEALLIGIDARPKHVMFAEGAEDPEKAQSDSRKDEIVQLAESHYAQAASIRLAFPNKQDWINGQLMAAGIQVKKEEPKK